MEFIPFKYRRAECVFIGAGSPFQCAESSALFKSSAKSLLVIPLKPISDF